MDKPKRSNRRIESIYDSPLPASRQGPLFNAHAYSTKIAPEAAGLMIASHTSPGATVFDGFGGSCTTALGALLCSRPTPEMIATAKTLRLPVAWGPRTAVVYELSGLGSFLGQTLCARPSPEGFRRAAESILTQCESDYGWMYRSRDDEKGVGDLRYAIWSDCIRCDHCRAETSLWDSSVRLNPAEISSEFRCKHCGHVAQHNSQSRSTVVRYDDVLDRDITSRKRILARIYGVTGERTWSRAPIAADRALLDRVHNTDIPDAFPVTPMMGKGGTHWGDLYRSGYHEGITHVHHFYTRRNLIALAAINRLIDQAPRTQRDILRLWLSSYNGSHSTLMSRVVAKSGQRDLVPTSNQPGVLYFSGLPVEKNVFDGLRRKITTIANALVCLRDTDGVVDIRHASSTRTHLADASVDYVFTDPPFGGNIPYSEANFLSEAWLGRITDTRAEAIISRAQGKGLQEYENLLAEAFAELHRIMKPRAKATIVFHSTQRSVWNALVAAFRASGFSVQASSVLAKSQGSFKQITAPNAVKGDALILLSKAVITKRSVERNVVSVIRSVVASALRDRDPQEQSTKRLYSRFIKRYVDGHAEPPLNAKEFYRQLEQHFVRDGELTLSK